MIGEKFENVADDGGPVSVLREKEISPAVFRLVDSGREG
jgi:hypothetical protein